MRPPSCNRSSVAAAMSLHRLRHRQSRHRRHHRSPRRRSRLLHPYPNCRPSTEAAPEAEAPAPEPEPAPIAVKKKKPKGLQRVEEGFMEAGRLRLGATRARRAVAASDAAWHRLQGGTPPGGAAPNGPVIEGPEPNDLYLRNPGRDTPSQRPACRGDDYLWLAYLHDTDPRGRTQPPARARLLACILCLRRSRRPRDRRQAHQLEPVANELSWLALTFDDDIRRADASIVAPALVLAAAPPVPLHPSPASAHPLPQAAQPARGVLRAEARARAPQA